MYLSKNSRYVLQKAQLLSPSFFKGVEKNLSVKTPKDDPSKPPLRLNIPDAKSFTSKETVPVQNASSVNANVAEGFKTSSENETQQFSKFTVDDVLVESALDPNPPSPESVRVSPEEVGSAGNVEQKDYSEGLQTVFQDGATEQALGEHYFKVAEVKENGKSDDVEQAQEKLTDLEGDINHKTLYIIIDVPEKRGEKQLSAENLNEEKISSFFQEKNSSSRRGAVQNTERKSRSLPRFSTYKQVIPRALKSNFQVHELAEASTYIFQLKLGKPNKGVVCVPERDIRTRHGDDKTDKTIKVRVNNGANHPHRKQVTVMEEHPETIKYADDGREVKRFKSEEGRKSGSFGNAEETGMAEGENAIQPEEQPSPRRPDKKDDITVNKFVKDDFGTIRNGIKNYPFKVPNKRQEKKQEAVTPEEVAVFEGIKHHLYDDIVTHKWWQNDPIAESKTHLELGLSKTDEKDATTKKNLEGMEAASPKQDKSSVTAQAASPSSTMPTEASMYVNISEIMPEKPPEDESPQEVNLRGYAQSEQSSSPQPRPQSKRDPEPQPSKLDTGFKAGTTDSSTAYCNIDELTQEDLRKTVKHIPEKKTRLKPKKPNQASKFTKLSQQADIKKAADSEAADFHTSAGSLTLAFENNSTELTKFGSAFPPLLNEALKNRFKHRKELPLGDKTEKGCNVEENSILFPEKRAEGLGSDSFFIDRDAIISKLIKNEKEISARKSKSVEKPSSEMAPPVDTLTVMKKVKEIVQFDLNNAVKIFNDGDVGSGKEQSSVVILKGERSWQVDERDLAKHVKMRKKEMRTSTTIFPSKRNNATNTGNESELPLHLPPRTRISEEIKLGGNYPNSVVFFDSKTKKFFTQKEALAKAITERKSATFEDVNEILNIKGNVKKAKSGDSILVFDVDTQSWKVDFSILEKRKQQQQLEEELTKRSEAILETFERLEKEQFASVPKPNSKEKKTFDYEKEEWKAYDSKSKISKAKLPYKKSNPEEIRKKNSDMFDNMFDGKKKTAKNPEGNSDPSNQKLCTSKQKDPPGNSPPKGSGSPPQPAKPDSKSPPAKPPKDEDHFWESFLKIQTPPRAIKDPPAVKIPPPKPPEPPPLPKELPRPNPPSILKIPKVEEPKREIAKKKIEEPRFRISLPFIRDKKIDKKKQTDPVPKTEGKVPTPGTKIQGKVPTPGTKIDGKVPPPDSKVEKKEPTPKVKAPSPPSSNVPKSDTPVGGTKKPPPTIGAPVKTPIGSPPASSNAKIQDPKPAGGKGGKIASASDHYVSDKIIEISRNKNHQSKIKSNRIETVKLNITSDTRMPSKITEINLNKKCEDKGKEPVKQPQVEGGSSKAVVPSAQGNGKKLNKHLENFKTPFSDPDFEEKSMKIKPDLESNPNLKKLDNWNKTLVLHDIMKPPENLESWLKDETDKMTSLLLKVLQEAGDAKTKKKNSAGKQKDKQLGRMASQDNARKKQKNLPENFFFRVQTMNLGTEKKFKPEDLRFTGKANSLKEPQKAKSLNEFKLPPSSTVPHFRPNLEDAKFKIPTETPANVVKKFPLEITEDVPGPAILKKISGAWKLFPVIGSQLTIFSLFRLFRLVNFGTSVLTGGKQEKNRSFAFDRLFTKYGPVVNVQGPLSGNVILLHKPEHINAVFDQDAPVRSVFDSLEQARRDFEEKSAPAVISTDWYKPEWNYLRRGTNDPIFKGLETYSGCSNAAADSLVYIIRKNRNAQDLVSEDFMQEIKKWSLEGVCNVLFEKSFGYLEGRTGTEAWILEPEKLYMAMEEASNYLSKCERGFQSWRLFSTPSLLGLSDSFRTISSVISKQLNHADVSLKNKGELIKNGSFFGKTDLTFIESMLLNDGLTPSEIICNLTDIMLISTNMMNSALGFLLYNLAQNSQSQKKLFSELKEALPGKNSQLNYNQINSLKYLQACLKESLRLHIPVPIFYRLLQSDILVANYIIPKGTYILMDYGLSSVREQNFLDPEKFIPERWLDEEKYFYASHPFTMFPFCQGPKGDLVKRVVELLLLTGTAKIVRNFGIEYHFDDIRSTETLISFPDKPLKFNFVERDT